MLRIFRRISSMRTADRPKRNTGSSGDQPSTSASACNIGLPRPRRASSHGTPAAGSTTGSGGTPGVAKQLECPLCLLELPDELYPNLSSCTHRACFDCLQQYLRIEISESRVNISCPECPEKIHPNDIKLILNDELMMLKYEQFMLRRILVAEPDARWCPAPDCGYVVIASGCAGCPKLQCNRPGCNTFFCYHCKQEWHPNQTCDAARAQRNSRLTPSRGSNDFDGHSVATRDNTEFKPCPICKVLIIKMDDGSCNHMTCSVCGTEFCWLCMKQISDLHYLSPSGCTFWGKKPWSRKKKIMWQLGMLVGAPVGIALIAGIAVPAIIIGIPVWVGRKLHARFERQSMSRPKRNMLVATGVVSSVLVSPILAAVSIGIGVPILLAYVYGVVPISLCRSGGCGVNTTGSGVKIELDEEAEIGVSQGRSAPGELNFPDIDTCINRFYLDGLSVDTALSGKPNPSIGEMSYGMSASISMGSGSHLDRVGGDRDSASNAPLAGSIASASASNKLEVATDVSSNKRFSFSSGQSETVSATVSFSERSANLSNYDDSSVRGLAGSIAGYHRDGHHTVTSSGSAAVTPVEVHVDCGDGLLETAVNIEAPALSPLSTSSAQPPSSTRCVSFQTNNTTPTIAAKSRSYELLNSFCDVCHTSHRPCCPNFSTSPNPSIASGNSTVPLASFTINSNHSAAAPSTTKSVMKKESNSISGKTRKSSIKSTTSSEKHTDNPKRSSVSAHRETVAQTRRASAASSTSSHKEAAAVSPTPNPTSTVSSKHVGDKKKRTGLL